MEGLFDLFDGFLKDNGYLAMGGQIIDATIVSAPKQHNSREENETIKDGGTPEDWKQKPAKNRQKAHDSPHFQMTPKASAKTGSSARIVANRSINGSKRTSGMVGINA